MKVNGSLSRLFLLLLVWMTVSVSSLWAQDPAGTNTGGSVQPVANDYPMWMKRAAAAAMLLTILLVFSMFLRGAREGWEKGKKQAESERIRKGK